MGSLEEYFPYPSYRPHQREMLERAASVAREGGIILIDAPTGSGKSSVAAALLSEAKGRKVLIAVRTISQLDTFVRELTLIRGRHPGLKFAYLVGKSFMCPLGGQGDVYRRCEVLKSLSSSLMRERAARGSLVPSRDPLIRRQIQKLKPDQPFLCPYYIHTRVFLGEEGGLRMVPSTPMKRRAEQLVTENVTPRTLSDFCGDLCPYETMLQAARGADVILLNFHHLFSEEIREQTYASLGLDPADTLLLIDEAHNCGDAIQSIESVVLDEGTLAQAAQDLTTLRKRSRTADAVRSILPELEAFFGALKNSREEEDWFDPVLFTRMVLRESLYTTVEDLVEDLVSLSDLIREVNLKAGEFRVSGIERVALFMHRIRQALTEPSFLSVYRRDGDCIVLEVRSIDPAPRIQAVAAAHACCVLISGTLSPVECYRRLYFPDRNAATLTLPNAFPRENRLVLGGSDITTAFRERRNPENIERIRGYIRDFMRLPGNRAVYVPSYQLLEVFSDAAVQECPDRCFIEPRESSAAQAVLASFLALPSRGESGLLLGVCGGKWSEGLDYRGDLLSAAMVIGLPLAPYNRVRQMIIQYFRTKFGPQEGEFLSYTLPALNRALQALGRVIRTPQDRGVLVFGDRRFLEPRIREALPPWIREELRVCDRETFRRLLEAWL